ncbi:MAG: histidinol-phosphate transaminase [Chitinophagaceae bacterium]
MSSRNINRRTLLRSGALLTGGLTFIPGMLSKAIAETTMPAAPLLFNPETDESVVLAAPPDVKARLSANENPFGPSPKAKQAIQDAINDSFRYAFGSSRELINKIATFEGLQQGQVMLAAGSSPLLGAAAAYFSKDGGSIVTADPSYDDLPRKAAMQYKANIIKVPLTADYKMDLDAMEKAITPDTKLVYLCNPNNPTATIVDTAKLKSFCERVSAKVPVFIDEAYIDYLDDPQSVTLIDLVKKGSKVIVARTFSKLYGFAGLRVGYAVAQPDMIRTLSNYCEGAMSISATSIAAAIASYQDKEYMQQVKAKTEASKKFLYDLLKKEGYEYVPSYANFVIFPLKLDSMKFSQEMQKRGVSIRTWKFAGKEWCRISIGRMDEMEAFAAAFKEIS